ncbi:MAG: hypothetical protein JW750_11525 [Anaerolineaceae bacterium]|nr:hypothetical protein [Anaerolineaceae bacterium]
MNPQILVPSLIAALHNLFTAAWIGGMIALTLAVLPGLNQSSPDPKSTLAAAGAVQKRMRFIAFVSIIGLAITGMLLTKRSPLAAGLFQFGTPYGNLLAVKHILMILMVLTAIVRTVFQRKQGKSSSPKSARLSMGLLLLNIVFGLGTLFLSSLLANM